MSLNNLPKPFLIDVKTAHKKQIVQYQKNGTAKILFENKTYSVPLKNQFSTIFSIFTDLNKSISRLSNSPLINGKTLRNLFDEEFSLYRKSVEHAKKRDLWEAEYGNYMYDSVANNLYSIPPEFWCRIGLYTNNGKLLTNAKGNKSWQEIRAIFDTAVVGIVGLSVGGNLLEGILREIRPKQIKIADPDWIEVTNLNRLERGSLRYITASKASRLDKKNPYDVQRISKVGLAVYEHSLVDPYLTMIAYDQGIDGNNIEQFLLGDSKEPKLDILVEEVDDFPMKYEIRKACKKHGIPVLMLSDFGHKVQVQLQDFRKDKKQSIGFKITDKDLEKLLEVAMSSGNRQDIFTYVRGLCGNNFASDEFADWVDGRGEQPTGSLPQSGATAMASGGIGGKIVALHLLGHEFPSNFAFDLKHAKIVTE